MYIYTYIGLVRVKMVKPLVFLVFCMQVVDQTVESVSQPKGIPVSPDYIPVLSTVAFMDPKNYLVALIRSIDFPVQHFEAVISVPNINKSLIEIEIVANSKIATYSIVIVDNNPGCAAGVNRGFKTILERGALWGLIVNNDVSFYPNHLHRIPKMFNRMQDPDIFILTGNCVFAIRANTIKQTGFYDENFYPAYVEDTDYHLRLHMTGMKKIIIAFTYLHNGRDMATKYVSGTSEAKNTVPHWSQMLTRGTTASRNTGGYFQRKWKVTPTSNFEAIAKKLHKTPFNCAGLTYKDWTLNKLLRQYIVTGQGSLQQALATPVCGTNVSTPIL